MGLRDLLALGGVVGLGVLFAETATEPYQDALIAAGGVMLTVWLWQRIGPNSGGD